jgi:lysine 2,3-aminomutase
VEPRTTGDWRAELKRAVRTPAELGRVLRLSPRDFQATPVAGRLPLLATRYYLSLCDPVDPGCPIRRQVVPSPSEALAVAGDQSDPLDERAHEVAPDLIRRYPDRALLLATSRCAVHCRFCTRSRLVGRASEVGSPARRAEALAYLGQHPEIREVIVSGGDPLVLSTQRLVGLLRELRRIPSVETIRIGTRTPAVLPQRITPELVAALRAYHPLWVMTHFNHPKELTPRARAACRLLVDGGFPLMNQTVLLRGINDQADVLAALFRGLVSERVRPYYLLQADPVAGTGHLRTPLGRGIELIAELQGRLSGLAIPKFIVDAPGGHGKVPLLPESVRRRGPGVTRLVTPRGTEVEYIDPVAVG